MNQRTMRISWGPCIACYFIIFAFALCITAIPSSLAVRQNHNKTLEAPRLVRRYDVVRSDDYRDDCLRTGKVQRLPAIFWTSFPTRDVPISQQGYSVATSWAKSFFGSRDAFVTYDSASDTFVDLNSVFGCDGPTEEEYKLQVARLSKGYSAAVHGIAYLVMPDDAPLYPESVWTIWEWPTITRNPFMEEVILVYLPSRRQTLFWARRDGPRGVPAPPGRKKSKA